MKQGTHHFSDLKHKILNNRNNNNNKEINLNLHDLHVEEQQQNLQQLLQKRGYSNFGNKVTKTLYSNLEKGPTKLSIPLPRPSASPESRSREQTVNSLSYWTPAATGSTCNRS